MCKLVFILTSILLFSAIEASKKRGQNSKVHLEKIKEVMGETYKAINRFDISDKHTSRALSKMANELFLNSQLSFHYFNIARNVAKDDEQLKEMFSNILNLGVKHAHKLQLSITGEAKKIKKILSETYQGYQDLIPLVLDVYLSNQNNQLVHNVLQNLLDVSLFTIYKAHAEVTNFKATNEELFKEIAKSVSKIEETGKKFNNTNPLLYDELVATTHVLASSGDKIVHKLERWLIAHPYESQTSETIRNVTRNIGKLVGNLRKSTNATSTIVSVRSQLRDFIGGTVLEFKILAEIPEEALPKYGYETLMDILLDAIAVAETANAKFNLLLVNKKI